MIQIRIHLDKLENKKLEGIRRYYGSKSKEKAIKELIKNFALEESTKIRDLFTKNEEMQQLQKRMSEILTNELNKKEIKNEPPTKR